MKILLSLALLFCAVNGMAATKSLVTDSATTSTANAIPRYDGTSGQLIKTSGVTVSDANLVTASGGFSGAVTGNVTGSASLNVLKAGDTMTGNLLFTDATYSIGAIGANRPLNVYVSNNVIGNRADFIGVSLTSGSGSYLGTLNRFYFTSSADGVVLLANSAATDFGRLQLGGTTASFPSIKRNATGIDIRLADDSGYAPLSAGTIFAGTGTFTNPGISFTAAPSVGLWYDGGAYGNNIRVTPSGSTRFVFTSNYAVMSSGVAFGWTPDSNLNTSTFTTPDTLLYRDGAANTLALRNSTSAQTFRIYNTYTDASNYERLEFVWSSNVCVLDVTKAGTGVQRGMVIRGSNAGSYIGFQADNVYLQSRGGTTYWNTSSSGHFLAGTDNTYDIGASGATRPRTGYFGTSLVVGGSGTTYGSGNASFSSALKIGATGAGDGIGALWNNGQTDFNRLCLGGTTSSFPAIKRTTTGIDIRLADDSAFGFLGTGGLNVGSASKTAAYTVTSSDHTIFCDSTAGAFTVTLPAAPATGQIVIIKKTGTDANTVTIGRNGKNIEGAAADLTLTSITRPCYELQYDGTAWWILSTKS